MTARVVVVGSINADLTVSAPHLPSAGETVVGSGPVVHQGGKGANAATAASRLGATVSIIAAVGSDEFGQRAVTSLAHDGVDTSPVAMVPGVATGAALIVLQPDGENLIAVGQGANSTLQARTVTDAVRTTLAKTSTAPGHRPCLLVGTEIPDDCVAAAIAIGRELGAHLVLDPAPARASLLDLDLRGVILTPNAGEARALSGTDDVRMAITRLCELNGGAPIVVTEGAQGALVQERPGEGFIRLSPPHDVRVVDTTGAGDTFAGALCTRLAASDMAADAARFAVAAGACAVRAEGARTAMPTAAEVRAALDG